VQQTTQQDAPGVGARLLTLILRLALPVVILAIAFLVMLAGFNFLRAGDAPKWLVVVVAIAWGVGGVAALYWIFNWIVERMGDPWVGRLQPFVFVGPAAAMLIWFLALPVLRTFWISLFNRDGPPDGTCPVDEAGRDPIRRGGERRGVSRMGCRRGQREGEQRESGREQPDEGVGVNKHRNTPV